MNHSPDPTEPVINQIPDNAPAVSFDIRLGKKYDFVDFDYDAFNTIADDLGISDDARSSLNVIVDKRIPRGLLTLGRYISSEKTVRIKANRKANNTAKHELSHAADDANVVEFNNSRYLAGKIGIASMYGLVYIETLNAIYSTSGLTKALYGDSVAEAAHNFSETGFPIAFVAANAAAIAGYYMHPIERKARQAAKQHQPDMLTLIPKTKRH